MCHLSRGSTAQSLIMKTNTDIKNYRVLKQMHSFMQDLPCVTHLLLSEKMLLLQVQPRRGGRREEFKSSSLQP